MAARLGTAIYWLVCLFALLIVAWAVNGIINDRQETGAYIWVIIYAGIIWFIGRLAQFVLAGR